jgi:hypothetical protein
MRCSTTFVQCFARDFAKLLDYCKETPGLLKKNPLELLSLGVKVREVGGDQLTDVIDGTRHCSSSVVGRVTLLREIPTHLDAQRNIGLKRCTEAKATTNRA